MEDLPECECAAEWDAGEYLESCANQSGCTNCDDDEDGSWCAAANQGPCMLNGELQGEGWFYCDAPSTGKSSIQHLPLVQQNPICTDEGVVGNDPYL